MRRFAMAGAVLTVGTMLGVLAPVAGSTAAWADGPQHVTSTITFDFTVPAGAVCDFAIRNTGTITDNVVIFPDRMIDHIVIHVAHTNVATGFTLTETDHATAFTAADGQIKTVGIEVHLRTPEGKIVVVLAGQVVVSATGEILKFTPNINLSLAAFICPALGG
jgi:hypothetical protein